MTSETINTATGQHQPIVIHRSCRSVLPQFLFAVLIGVLGIVIGQHSQFFSIQIELPWGGKDYPISLSVFFLLFLWLIIRPITLMFDQKAQITDHHLRLTSGIWSFRKINLTIPMEDVRGVRIEQNILERLLGVGRIIAWTHSASTPEVCIVGVGSPQRISEIINSRVDQAHIRAQDRQK